MADDWTRFYTADEVAEENASWDELDAEAKLTTRERMEKLLLEALEVRT